MEVYIEYAFIENFALDCALVCLAFKFARAPLKISRMFLSAFLGAILAVAYPFFSCLSILAVLFKTGFPLLACWVGFGGKIRKKERGRYALSVASYYGLSFAFAGAVYAFCGVFGIDYAVGDGLYIGVPIGTVCAVCVFTGLGAVALVKAVYKRRKLTRFLYPCLLKFKDRQVRAEGYLDSGNLAKKGGIPICFVNAELFFDLFGLRAFDKAEEELAIATVAGERKIKLFVFDELWIYSGRKKNIVNKPYCAVSPALQGKEYGVLFGAWAIDGFENAVDERLR